MAGLGAQDGATDGQVGGTWGPKWVQHGQNKRSKNQPFFLMALQIDVLWILADFGTQNGHQHRTENRC